MAFFSSAQFGTEWDTCLSKTLGHTTLSTAFKTIFSTPSVVFLLRMTDTCFSSSRIHVTIRQKNGDFEQRNFWVGDYGRQDHFSEILYLLSRLRFVGVPGTFVKTFYNFVVVTANFYAGAAAIDQLWTGKDWTDSSGRPACTGMPHEHSSGSERGGWWISCHPC